MQGHELWFTALLNDHLAGPANAVLTWAGTQAETPARPWSNFVAMEIVVAAAIVVVFALLRPRLSVGGPGPIQQSFELVYVFLRNTAQDVVGPHAHRYVAYFGTLFIFILFSNLLGIIPTFESPTMFAAVPLGCALATFVYYNLMGIREQGVGRYLKHFAGPMPLLAPLMVPIELISHMSRPLSLTIRLYANMYAGEQVTLAFLALVPLVIPVAFMGLHIFVAFLQAFVFTLLTMVYVAGAVAHEH